uniref:Uncharacterized protein n=1 Tax=Caenorhabditis tropicalis TaxID=1561998 RepID=A0A1I7TBS5_9PELO
MQRAAKYLYIIGGCALASEREPIRTIERIHVEKLANNPPSVKIISRNYAELALPRRSPSCFLTENRQNILISGGCTAPNEHTDTMEILRITEENGESQLLAEKLEIGASCSGFDVETSSPQKPIFGGFEAHSCLDKVQVVTESTWKCEKLAKKLPKIKNSTVLEVKREEFLMFGGWEDEQRTSKAIRRIKFNENFTDYSVDFAGFLPYPVEGHSCTRIGSSVLLIGGFDGCFVIDTIIKYDLETKKSEVIPTKLREKRENHVSAVLSDKYLVVAGGWNSRKALDDVEVFCIKEGAELERCHVEGSLLTARNRPTGVPL